MNTQRRCATCRSLRIHEFLLSVLVTGTMNTAFAEDNPGRDLYHSGKGAMAVLLQGKARVPAARFPCANCHGEDGMGGKEGGTTIPPVSWEILSKATASRPRYATEEFQHAVLHGVAANGAALNELMPRYETDSLTLFSLIEYLKTLDKEQRVGISSSTINIMPPESADARIGFVEAIKRFNNEGGSYGRMVDTKSDGHYFFEADTVANLIEKPLQDAIQKRLLKHVVDDGLTTVAVSTGTPDSELQHTLEMAGISYDKSAPTLIIPETHADNRFTIDSWLAHVSTEQSSFMKKTDQPLRIYAPVSAIGPYLHTLDANRYELLLVDLDEPSVRWALSEHQSAEAATGQAVGNLLVEAILQSGRNPTRHAVTQYLETMDLQNRLFTLRRRLE